MGGSPAERVLIRIRRRRGFFEAAAGVDGAAQANQFRMAGEFVGKDFQIAEGAVKARRQESARDLPSDSRPLTSDPFFIFLSPIMLAAQLG